MSIDLFGVSEAKTAADFLVQIGILTGFAVTFFTFLYKFLNSRLNRAIDAKIEPVKQLLVKTDAKIDTMQKDMCTTARNKEELDRERFRNVSDGQAYIKDTIKSTIENTDEVKKKLESHLQESASFIARTNERMARTDEKFVQIDQQMIDFRSFMRMVESR